MQELSRRRILAGMGVGAAGLALAACTSSEVAGPSGTVPGDTATTLGLAGPVTGGGEGSFQLFSQADLEFQTLLALGPAGQCSEVGEVIAAVNDANDAAGGATYQSVADAFTAMGDTVAEQAAEAERAGHLVTAGSRYLRAAKYYAQPLYWALGTSDPGSEAAVYRVMDDAFVAGMKLLPYPNEAISIDYVGGSFPGWFIRPDADDRRRPTVIMNNGSDGQNVDLLGQGALAALQRGYNVVIFEGPGQGSQLFLGNVPFRPDWENVLSPIVDWLEKRSDVDPKKIVVRGISFGGLLVPRAASKEHRFAAVVADPGCLQTKDDYPPIIQQAGSEATPEDVNQAWAVVSAGATPVEKFNLMKSMEIFTQASHEAAMEGELVTDFDALWTTILQYDVTDLVADITNPTMVLQYEQDTFFGDQGQELYDKLTVSTKQFHQFTAVEGAQYHCGPMAPQRTSEVVYDWVDSVLAG